MRLRDRITRLAKKLETWAFGESLADITIHDDMDWSLVTPTEDQPTKEYVDELDAKWRGTFVNKNEPGYLASIDRANRRRDHVLEALPILPTGAYDSGPKPEDSKHLNELYNNSDNYGMLPTGHYYLFIDGVAVNVVKNMRIEGEWDHIYLDSWNRYGYRANYEQEMNE